MDVISVVCCVVYIELLRPLLVVGVKEHRLMFTVLKVGCCCGHYVQRPVKYILVLLPTGFGTGNS